MSSVEQKRILTQELREQFGAGVEDDLLEECAALCAHHAITVQDFYWKWEAATMQMTPRVLNRASIDAVKQYLATQVFKSKVQKSATVALNGRQSRNLLSMVRGTKIKTEPKAIAGPSRVRLTKGDLSSGRSYRYMYEKISERSEALDDRIEEFAELVQKHYNIADLGDPAASTEEEVTVVGRITFDADSSSVGPIKLNEATLTLESSRAMGSGARAPLRFDPGVKVHAAKNGRGGAGFFPGAIVALRGKNGGGGWFLVTEVLTLPPAPPSTTAASGEPFTACVACGPFTSDSDLKYEPWRAALKKIGTLKPDVIVLVGPFIDSSHNCVKNGDIDDSPYNLFRKTFLDPLSDTLDQTPGSLAVLIPSVKDIISDHAVFPQTEFGAALVSDPRIYLVSNPGFFAINGVPFAASSVDVLFHLRKEEFFKRMPEIHPVALAEHEAPATDAMANLCRHLLEQRSLYPLFPAPHDLAHEVNLDISHSHMLRLGSTDTNPTPPALLILPSKLKQFSKVIDRTTVINPSYVSKGLLGIVKYTGASGLVLMECEMVKYDAEAL